MVVDVDYSQQSLPKVKLQFRGPSQALAVSLSALLISVYYFSLYITVSAKLLQIHLHKLPDICVVCTHRLIVQCTYTEYTHNTKHLLRGK
jgi:hypothetical protein